MKKLLVRMVAVAAALTGLIPAASQAGHNLNHSQTLLRG
jgi:hypothetical protein